MRLRIAIQPDHVIHPNGKRHSFSERWTELAYDQNVEAVPMDVLSPDALARVLTCDAFMWRCASSAPPRLCANRLLCGIEEGLGIPVFPSHKSSMWYFKGEAGLRNFFAPRASRSRLQTFSVPIPGRRVLRRRRLSVRAEASRRAPIIIHRPAGADAGRSAVLRR